MRQQVPRRRIGAVIAEPFSLRRWGVWLVCLMCVMSLGLPAMAPTTAAPVAAPVSVTTAAPMEWTSAAPMALSRCTRQSLRRVKLVRNGINIDKRCQRAYITRKGRIIKVWLATTGKPGYRTRSGHWRIYRRINGWSTSKLYAGARMYRALYFSGGQAVHGSIRDSLVKRYPASHGCVRLWRRNVDWLWAHGYARIGTRVYVF